MCIEIDLNLVPSTNALVFCFIKLPIVCFLLHSGMEQATGLVGTPF